MRQIIYYNNPQLRQPSRPVEQINQHTFKLVNDMLQLMRERGGIGLAAPQIGVNKRIIVIGSTRPGEKPSVLINPEIVLVNDMNVPFEEGCLSLPGLQLMIYRPNEIQIKGYNVNGNFLTLSGDGLWARVVQHEIDHLNGTLITDHVTNPYERQQIDAYLTTDPARYSKVKAAML